MTKRRLTRRQRQVRRNRIILACAAAALLIIIIVIISVSMKGCSKSKKTDKNGESTTAKVEESTQTKENESTSEEVSSTDTNTDTSSIMSDATSVPASSDSSEFAPPVVPSGNTVSKVLLLKASRFRKLMEQLILTEYLLPIRHMLFLRISFPLILTSLLMQTEVQHVLTRLL